MPKWTHSDPLGLQTQFEASLVRSKAGVWNVDPLEQRGAELRAFTMGTVLTAYRCVDPREFMVAEMTIYDFPPKELWPTVQHQAAAGRVLDTLTLLADGHKPSISNFITAGGLPAQNLNVEGWPIVLAVIAASAIWAFAGCYIAERYEDTLDRFLARGQAGTNMMAAQSDALKLIENHADQETKMGKILAYTPQEQAVLDNLLKTQETFAAAKDPPKDHLPSIGETSMGIGTMLGLAVVAYFLLKGQN